MPKLRFCRIVSNKCTDVMMGVRMFIVMDESKDGEKEVRGIKF